jgi:hypothetical protein
MKTKDQPAWKDPRPCEDCPHLARCAEDREYREDKAIVAKIYEDNPDYDPLYIPPYKKPSPIRVAVLMLLIVTTIIVFAVFLIRSGDPADIAVAEVWSDPDGSPSFWLEEGEYEVWHEEALINGSLEIMGPGNKEYFSGDTGSGATSINQSDTIYERIGTFEADEGNYTVYSSYDTHIFITEPTVSDEVFIIVVILSVITPLYGLYIYTRT